MNGYTHAGADDDETKRWAREELASTPLDVALDEYDVSADAQAAVMGALTGVLGKLYVAASAQLDEEDTALEELASWVEHVHGYGVGDSDEWEVIYAPGFRICGVKVRVGGLEARYELSETQRLALHNKG